MISGKAKIHIHQKGADFSQKRTCSHGNNPNQRRGREVKGERENSSLDYQKAYKN